MWADIYNFTDLRTDGSQWDQSVRRRRKVPARRDGGRRPVLARPHALLRSPMSFGDAAFVHDTLFMPDTGTARADFPGGSARQLWRFDRGDPGASRRDAAVHRPRLPARMAARRAGKARVAEQKRTNIHVAGRDEAAFVALREARDRTLPMPKLILHALQVNLQRRPAARARGQRPPLPEIPARRVPRRGVGGLRRSVPLARRAGMTRIFGIPAAIRPVPNQNKS